MFCALCRFVTPLTRAKDPTMTAPKKQSSQNAFMFPTSPQRMHFRIFGEKQVHLEELITTYYLTDYPLINFMLPQLSAHGALEIVKQLVTELFFHLVCIRSSLHSTSPSSPPAVSGAPWPSLSTASTAAPAARSCSTTAAWPN